jgi:hypothetical protein
MDFRYVLKKRRTMVSVIKKRYEEMGNPIPKVILDNAGKMAFLPTHIASGSTIDFAFAGEARRRGLLPVWTPFSEDTFQSINQRKKMFLTEINKFGDVTKLANPNKWDGKKISEIVLDSGENLVEYHLEKWNKITGKKAVVDMSDWLKFFGNASEYYYHDEILNTFFGVKFWPSNLPLYKKGEKEKLVNNIMRPAKEKVFEEFGLEPICHSFDLKPFSL